MTIPIDRRWLEMLQVIYCKDIIESDRMYYSCQHCRLSQHRRIDLCIDWLSRSLRRIARFPSMESITICKITQCEKSEFVRQVADICQWANYLQCQCPCKEIGTIYLRWRCVIDRGQKWGIKLHFADFVQWSWKSYSSTELTLRTGRHTLRLGIAKKLCLYMVSISDPINSSIIRYEEIRRRMVATALLIGLNFWWESSPIEIRARKFKLRLLSEMPPGPWS